MANVSSWFIREITGIFSNEGTSKNWPIMFNSNILRGKRIKMFERAYLSVTSMHQLSKVWAKFHFMPEQSFIFYKEIYWKHVFVLN